MSASPEMMPSERSWRVRLLQDGAIGSLSAAQWLTAH
jgi:hypothetical protein